MNCPVCETRNHLYLIGGVCKNCNPKELIKKRPDCKKPIVYSLDKAKYYLIQNKHGLFKRQNNYKYYNLPTFVPDEDDAKPGERKGVAEGPAVSNGGEPQRRAPRVVYPGPGAQAPTPSSE